MTFNDFMLNISIGILSGAFSSIIISRVFLIISDHNEQITRVQKHIEITYRLTSTIRSYLYMNKTVTNPDDIFTLDCLNKELSTTISEIANSECDKFDTMIFDDLNKELKDIAIALEIYMIHLCSVTTVTKEILEEIKKKLTKYQNDFVNYKKNKIKHLKKLLFNDPLLRICFFIIIAIVIITLLSSFLQSDVILTLINKILSCFRKS